MVSLIATTDRLIIGSDWEKSVVKAAQAVFYYCTHILRTCHLQQNTKQELTDDSINVQSRNKILLQIYEEDGITTLFDNIFFEYRCDILERQ